MDRVERLPEWAIQPVRMLGTTWYDRGPRYWLRRVGISSAYLFLTLFCGGFSALYVKTIVGVPEMPPALRVVVVVVAVAVVLGSAAWSVRYVRQVASGRRTPRSRGQNTRIATWSAAAAMVARVFAAGGILVLSALIGFGGMAAMFVASLMPRLYVERPVWRRLERREHVHTGADTRAQPRRGGHGRRGAKT